MIPSTSAELVRASEIGTSRSVLTATLLCWNDAAVSGSGALDSDLVSEAIVVWTGYGDPTTSSPIRDERRIVEHFGSELAVELMPVLRDLEDEFYQSDAKWLAHDVVTMGDTAQRDFVHKHPELSAEAARALAWCYTFDYK